MTFEIPLRLGRGLNSREHWSQRARRVRRERLVTLACWPSGFWHVLQPSNPGGEWVVTLTYVGPRKVDSDNLQGALKGVRDQVAHGMGLDDGSEAVLWLYAQERGPYSVRVTVTARPEWAAAELSRAARANQQAHIQKQEGHHDHLLKGRV